PAAPGAERVAEQGTAPAEHERAASREPRARAATLCPNEQARGSDGEQHVAGAGETEIRVATVLAPGFEHRLHVQVAPHGEPFAAALERELQQVHRRSAQGWIRPDTAVRGRGRAG